MSAVGGAGRIRLSAHGGVQLSCLRAGPVGGEPVVLLHGFPESADLGWRHQLPALAAAGFRAWAPDQRGYGESDRPDRVRDYVIGNLAADAQAVLEAAAREAGRDRAHLVAHDWGGGVAWWVTLSAPGRVASLTVLNCPHPLVLRRALSFRNPRQMARSWYMVFFQLPWLPEALGGAAHAAWLATMVRRSGRRATPQRPATFDDATLRPYREQWSRPGALRAMIHWYRALRHAPSRPPGPPDGRVQVPVRIIWGTGDTALGRELAPASVALCDGGDLQLLDATHWVQHDEPDRVNDLLVSWIRAHPAPRRP